MYCQNCGNEINDNAVVCIHCGAAVNNPNNLNNPANNPEFQIPKTGMGVLFAILLGLIGLVIGLLIYPTGTIARSTFLKGWGITFAICAGVSILFSILYVAFVFSILGSAGIYF